jgi:YidC/Oxa1 family membrane protein insertase
VDRNFLLALGLSFLVLTLWTWYTAPTTPPGEAPATTTAPATPPGGPEAAQPEPLAPSAALPAPAPAPAPPTAAPGEETPAEQQVTLETDLVRASFSSRGGSLVHWQLQKFDDAYQPGRPRVELTAFDPQRAVGLFTPLDSLGYGDLRFVPYTVEQPDAQSVVFTRDQAGARIRKTYRVEPGSYVLQLRIELENGTERLLMPTFRLGWPSVGRSTHDWSELSLAALVEGSLEQTRLGKGGVPASGFFGGGSSEPIEYPAEVAWAGADTRYFLAALIPELPREAAARLTPAGNTTPATVEVAQRPVQLPPGQKAAREYRVYLGPKEAAHLEAAGAQLDEAVLKGWFPALTNFFTAVLVATHRIVPNYGVAIILITIVVRLLMYPVMQRQMRSMKRMSAMQPRLKEIQEKFADDKERQSQEMMKAYKESGFNPLTGCLPMFLQLPVFIGLYYALQGAIACVRSRSSAGSTTSRRPRRCSRFPGSSFPCASSRSSWVAAWCSSRA